jgi:hypothetical protein
MKLLLGIALICAVVGFSGSARASSPVRIASKDRVLLVTANLTTHGQPKFRWLYKFLDASSVFLAKKSLGGTYRKLYLLGGKNATAANFILNIPKLAHEETTQALDVMVHLHGAPGALWFEDNGYSTAWLRDQLRPTALKGKARLFYSTACYGKSHAQDFVDAGFQVASGSVGVNADSAFSYPATMLKWRHGSAYWSVVRTSNSRISIWLSDRGARLMGFDDVNSFKVIKGDAMARISLGAPRI